MRGSRAYRQLLHRVCTRATQRGRFARAPPQTTLGPELDADLDMDQTPTFDPADPEPAPDDVFD